MPVSDLADPEGCHLYLWATNNYLPAAFECIKAWGFEYITTITWMKDKVGLGQYYRGITEHCLFATTKKRLPYKIDGDKRCQGVTGFYEPKTIHSRKPIQMREMIEIVSYAPRKSCLLVSRMMTGTAGAMRCNLTQYNVFSSNFDAT